jgi:hypothetical protein
MFSIFNQIFVSISLSILDLGLPSKACFGPFSTRPCQRLVGRFIGELILERLETIAKLYASEFMPYNR